MNKSESVRRTSVVLLLSVVGLAIGLALGASAGALFQREPGEVQAEFVDCGDLPHPWTAASVIEYDAEAEVVTLQWSAEHVDGEHGEAEDRSPDDAQEPMDRARSISAVPSKCDDPLLADYLRSVGAASEDIARADCNRLQILVDGLKLDEPIRSEAPGEPDKGEAPGREAELRPDSPNTILVIPDGWSPDSEPRSRDDVPFELDLDVVETTLDQCRNDFG